MCGPARDPTLIAWRRARTVSRRSLLTRHGRDYTAELPAVAREVAALPGRELVLDGEVCALDARGLPSFRLLQNRRRGVSLAYFVFDLLARDGEDLRPRPIEERREALLEVVGEGRDGTILASTASDGDLRSVMELACRRGLEGVVAKQNWSTYVAGSARRGSR